MINSISSDPFPIVSDSKSTSTSSVGGSGRREIHSDEEVTFQLATSRPKKRAGRRVFKETRHPIFRGVRKRNGEKWVCELREPYKKTRIWLGTYPTPEMAARAHDVAALAFRGKCACLNFADSAWRLPAPGSTSAFDIRRAAAEAAKMFRPRGNDGNKEGYNGDVLSDEENFVRAEFVDEEAIFDMPGLLVDMAEGLLLSPPRCDFFNSGEERETEFGDVSLWSYSFG